MLNSYKKINFKKAPSQINFFWNIPFPVNSRLNMPLKPKTDFLNGLSVVFGTQPLLKKGWQKKHKKMKLKKPHFFFSKIIFNSIFLFKKFPKNKNIAFGNIKLKKRLLLVNKLFCTKNRYKSYSLKRNKGGFITSTLGFRSFMPKSHSNRLLTNKAPIEWLLGFKLKQRRQRFSAHKTKLTANFISSSKSLKKSIFLKKREHIYGRNQYWSNVAASVNRLIKKS